MLEVPKFQNPRGLESPLFPPESALESQNQNLQPNYSSVYKSVFNPDRINFQESFFDQF